MSRHFPALLALANFSVAISWTTPLLADTFGSGANQFDIEFVEIGNPNNPNDTRGQPSIAGSVPYVYRIGRHEIPEDSIRKANAATASSPNPLAITLDSRGPNKPATSVSWIEAIHFVNWLNTSEGYTPAYKFLPITQQPPSGGFALWDQSDPGFNPSNPYRNSLAHYFLPGIDEWYKAAYYDASVGSYFRYPNGSLDPPEPTASGTLPNTAVYRQCCNVGPSDVMLAGGMSPYGTIGQGGNVYEWQESGLSQVNSQLLGVQIIRGGSWDNTTGPLSANSLGQVGNVGLPNLGFRVASVPEPSLGRYFLLIGAPFVNCIRRVVFPIRRAAKE